MKHKCGDIEMTRHEINIVVSVIFVWRDQRDVGNPPYPPDRKVIWPAFE